MASSGAEAWQSGFAEVNGTRLYYEVAGEGNALTLLHAGIADSRMWDDQFSVFATRYRTVRYDLRGFGRSEVPPGEYTLRDDLAGLLQTLGIARTTLVGVSLGGSLAVDFALEHPEMVEALVLVGAGLSGFTPEMASLSTTEAAHWQEIEAADAAGDAERLNALETHLWVDGLGRTPEMVNPTLRERVMTMNGNNIARATEQEAAQPQKLDPPAIGRLGEIAAPTLVIVGDEDSSIVQATAETLTQGIAGARKVVMRGTAHVPNMEQPEEFNRLVLAFLAGVEGQR